MPTALQVRNISKDYGKRMVLNNISFEVNKGEIFGIIGMSGSGKTTLLNHLIGFIEPDEGEILYGNDLKKLRKNYREVTHLFGFAPQNPSFYPKLTVYENLMHFGILHKLKTKDIKESINHLLSITKLEQHKDNLSEHLSGGQQKRLSIMCGLIHKPEILILDEPTADLDPILRDETWRFVKQVNQLGTTIVVASHFLQELESSCSRVAIILNGQILRQGTIDQVKKGFAKDSYEVNVETEPKNFKTILEAIKGKKVLDVVKDENKLTIYTLTPHDVSFEIARMLKSGKIDVKSLKVHKPSLREVFEKIAQ